MMKRMAMMWLLLSGCGGGGGGDAGAGGGTGGIIVAIDPRLGRLDIYESQKIRVLGDAGAGVMGLPTSAVDALPDTGSASFAGFATLRVEGAVPLVLSGDANLAVDFANQQISGQMGQFFGTNNSGAVVDYSGAVAITGGQVRPDLRLDYTGQLIAPGQVLRLDGALSGQFLGNPVAALSAAELDANVLQNGQTRPATMLVIMEGGL
jgi:hypothetical protein